jgi:hypothetical protein
MEKKKIGKAKEPLSYIVLGIALCISIVVLVIAPCLYQKLLAFSIVVAIGGCIINVWKIFKSADKMDSVVDSLDSVSNKLDELKVEFVELKRDEITQTKDIEEQRRKDEREPVKQSLIRRIDIFISCWENGKEIYQKRTFNGMKFQKDLIDVGNALKKQIGDDEKRLPQNIIVEANDMADDIIELAKRMRPRVIQNENDEKDIRKYHEVLEEGDRIVRKAKELKKKLGAGGNE